jgi:hypothetical protein
MGLKEKIARLHKAMEGRVDYIELVDGSRYFYKPEQIWGQVFKHAGDCLTADYKSEQRPEPPPILEAVARARDRRSAIERLYAPGSHPLVAYSMEALVERGEFVPRSFLANHSYEESLEHC